MEEIVWEPVQYAVFRRMDGNVITGFSVRTLVAVVLGLFLGALLFVGAGLITHEVEKPYGYAKAADAQQHASEMATAVRYVELRAKTPQDKWELELGGMRKYSLGAYTEEEIEDLAREGVSLGMTSNTTATQAQEMAPKTEVVTECVLGGLERVVLAFVPALIAGIFFFDYKGISLSREVLAYVRWARAQKRYYHTT